MSRSPILFRCDGTTESGWEPFYQCMTLAQAIQRRRRPTHFLSRLDPVNLSLTIHRGGHEWIPALHPVGTSDDLDDTLKQARDIRASSVCVVAPNVSVEYLRELTASGLMVITVHPEANLDYPNRLVINPFLGVGPEQYHLARGTQLLVGPRFGLVRGMVRRVRPLRSQEPPAPFRAMIALGDDNVNLKSAELAKELLDLPKVDKVTIVARSHHPKIEEFRNLAKDELGRVEVISENAEVSTRLTRVHFAITSGDTWSLEMACMGLPQIVLPENPRYAANAQRLDDEGCAINLGPMDKATNGQIRTTVNEILLDPMERRAMARIGRQLIDGRGTDRFVNGTEMLLHVGERSADVLPFPTLDERRMAA